VENVINIYLIRLGLKIMKPSALESVD